MLNSKWNLALLVILAGCAAPRSWASSVTLFDNTSFVTGGYGLISGINPIGDSFSTGGLPVPLTDFAAVLFLQGGVNGSTTFSLYSDDSETPGTLIAALGTIEDSSLTLIPAEHTLSDLDIALAADTGTGFWRQQLAVPHGGERRMTAARVPRTNSSLPIRFPGQHRSF